MMLVHFVSTWLADISKEAPESPRVNKLAVPWRLDKEKAINTTATIHSKYFLCEDFASDVPTHNAKSHGIVHRAKIHNIHAHVIRDHELKAITCII